MTAHDEEQILVAVVEKTGKAYQDAPTVANLREWTAAKGALEKYRKAAAEPGAGLRWRKVSEIARWLVQQGYQVQERTVRNHLKARRFSAREDGEFHQEDIEVYAERELKRPGTDQLNPAGASHKDRLTAAMADERELKTKKLKGELIDAGEEEARDARLWRAVRNDIENYAPNVITELVERVIACGIPEEIRPRITALVPELREMYEDFLAEMFERYAREGGMVVEAE